MIFRFKSFGHRSSKYFLLFLIGIDLAFILVSVLRSHIGFIDNGAMLSVSRDGSYAEYFQYSKFAAIVVVLCFFAKAQKSALIAGWSLVFSMLGIDDVIEIHERLGSKIANWLSIPPMYNLRSVDYGEMIVYLILGCTAVGILAFSSRIDKSSIARQTSKGLLLLVAALAFFGGLVDMLHSATSQVEVFDSLFGVVEDGGEMIVVSLMLWFVYYCFMYRAEGTLHMESSSPHD